jgi:hypothetical protein
MKVWQALFIFALGYHTVFAQSGIIDIHAGYMNPKDAKAGMLIGGMFGTKVDEAVDVGIGFDVFHKSYADVSQVAQSDETGLTSKTYVTEVDYSRTIIPLHIVINVKIRAGRYFGYLIRGGLGYQFLISKEQNYELETTDTRRYGGLGWQGAAGLYYNVGDRSTLTADVFYNNAQVSRSVDKSTRGLPTQERVSLSGLGIRLGVILDMR